MLNCNLLETGKDFLDFLPYLLAIHRRLVVLFIGLREPGLQLFDLDLEQFTGFHLRPKRLVFLPELLQHPEEAIHLTFKAPEIAIYSHPVRFSCLERNLTPKAPPNCTSTRAMTSSASRSCMVRSGERKSRLKARLFSPDATWSPV